MDWDMKTPSWDFLEFEREGTQNITSFAGSSSGVDPKTRGDCSVDLKLGRLGDLGDGIGMVNNWKDPRDSAMPASSSPLGPMKRARIPGNGPQTVSCLVDGCSADLSKCRDYHRRHKVCEIHSKTPTVMVGGQEQRFCQQCSRFHMLVEFDEVKRSCRKRLDGHNRRRRKPQPESLSMNIGSSFSNHQGTRLLPFGNAQVLSTNLVTSAWTPVVKTEEDTTVYNNHPSLHYVDGQNLFPGSFSRSYKGEKQFPFLPVNEPSLGHRTTPDASICQPLLNTISPSESGGSSRKMFSDGLTRVFDSDCALSLLSSPPTQTSGIAMSHVVQPDPIPIAQPLAPGLQYNGLGRYQPGGMEGESMGSVLVSNINDAEIHCHGIFNVGPDGSSQDGVQQTLPFSWD